MRRRIIAIGGGRVRCPRGRVPQTLAIDEEIVRITRKKSPRLLFVPTATVDDPEYAAAVRGLYEKRLGCRYRELLLYRDRPASGDIRHMILSSDIIYVGGGNTLRMLRLWRRLGVDKFLDQAWRRGVVLCGVSAGAICWFRQGNSDSRKFADAANKTLIRVSGLGFVDALACPHYDVERHRKPALKEMTRKDRSVAIALENCTAIDIADDRYRILTSAPDKNAYCVYWDATGYHREVLQKDGKWRNLPSLLKRSQGIKQDAA